MFTDPKNGIPSGFKELHQKIWALALRFLEYLHSLQEAEVEWVVEKGVLWDVRAWDPIYLMQGKGYIEAGGGVGANWEQKRLEDQR